MGASLVNNEPKNRLWRLREAIKGSPFWIFVSSFRNRYTAYFQGGVILGLVLTALPARGLQAAVLRNNLVGLTPLLIIYGDMDDAPIQQGEQFLKAGARH